MQLRLARKCRLVRQGHLDGEAAVPVEAAVPAETFMTLLGSDSRKDTETGCWGRRKSKSQNLCPRNFHNSLLISLVHYLEKLLSNFVKCDQWSPIFILSTYLRFCHLIPSDITADGRLRVKCHNNLSFFCSKMFNNYTYWKTGAFQIKWYVIATYLNYLPFKQFLLSGINKYNYVHRILNKYKIINNNIIWFYQVLFIVNYLIIYIPL